MNPPINMIAIPPSFVALCRECKIAGQIGSTLGESMYIIATTDGLDTFNARQCPHHCTSDEEMYLSLWQALREDIFDIQKTAIGDIHSRILGDFKQWVTEQITLLAKLYGV